MNDNDDIAMIKDWQTNKDPNVLGQLMLRYNPLIYSVTNKYKNSGISPIALRTQARTQLLKSLNTFNPNKGAIPITHIYNNLQKIHRTALEGMMSGHIPENRALKRSTFTITRDNLADRLGREPNNDEMADELSWSQSEVARMNKELGGEVNASNAEFDFYGNSTTSESKDKILADYLYKELDNKDKLIFEHTFGYGNKPILKNKDLAKVLGVNEMSVHRSKQRLSEKIKSYR